MSPYNTSKEAFERWREELDLLLTGQVVSFPTENAHMLAYSLREAIQAAKVHAIEPYNKIQYLFRERKGAVLAEPRKRLVHSQGRAAPASIDLPEGSEFGVVQAVQKYHNYAEIRFPHFVGDYHAVERWALANGYLVEFPPLKLTKETIKGIPISKMLHKLSHPPEEKEEKKDAKSTSRARPATRRPRSEGDSGGGL